MALYKCEYLINLYLFNLSALTDVDCEWQKCNERMMIVSSASH